MLRSVVPHRTTFTDNNDHSAGYMFGVAAVRDVWFGHGLRACPPIARRRNGLSKHCIGDQDSKPELVWLPSPPAGSDLIATEGLATTLSFAGDGVECISARIATMLSESRRHMDTLIARGRSDWPHERRAIEAARTQSPYDSSRVGISTNASCDTNPDARRRRRGELVWTARSPSGRVLRHVPPVRARQVPLRRCRATRPPYRPDRRDRVVVGVRRRVRHGERPTALHAEPIPGRVHNERRLHHPDAPALEFDDGLSLFVHHGIIVPD